MKRTKMTFFTIALLLAFFVMTNTSHADGPPPPPPGGLHGGGGNAPPGGGAPIGEGTLLLMIMAVGYSIKQIVDVRRKYKDEHDVGNEKYTESM
ncbi:MAG: hypothetical protein ACOYMF_11810 [Bacteroidales bacterium]